MVEALEAIRVLLDRADYFAILGVGRDAGSAEVAHAHALLVRQTEHAAARGGSEAAALARHVRQGVDEAFEVLCDAQLRRAYRRNLSSSRF